MRNMLKADIRRLLRARSLYVGMLVIALVVAIATAGFHFLTTQSVEGLTRFARNHAREDSGNMQAGLAMAALISPESARQAMLELRRQTGVQTLSQVPIQQVGVAHLMLVIVVTLFAAKDYHTGYLKNLLTLKGIKTKWLLSKVVMALVVSILLSLAALASAMVGAMTLGNPPTFDVGLMAGFFGVHIAVDLALAASVLLVLTLSQNKTAALMFGMLEAFNLQRAIYLLLDATGWISSFQLSDYAMMNLAAAYAPGDPPGQVLWTAAILFAVYLTGAWLAITRRDLKL